MCFHRLCRVVSLILRSVAPPLPCVFPLPSRAKTPPLPRDSTAFYCGPQVKNVPAGGSPYATTTAEVKDATVKELLHGVRVAVEEKAFEKAAAERQKASGKTRRVPPPCDDVHEDCDFYAGEGECENNQAWMKINCKKSCGEPFGPPSIHIPPTPTQPPSLTPSHLHSPSLPLTLALPHPCPAALTAPCGNTVRAGGCVDESHFFESEHIKHLKGQKGIKKFAKKDGSALTPPPPRPYRFHFHPCRRHRRR